MHSLNLIVLKKKIKHLPIINIAQNKSYSIKCLAKIISIKLSYKINFIQNNNYQKVHKSRQLDNTFFKKIFKNFKFINIESGIENSISYYKEKLGSLI